MEGRKYPREFLLAEIRRVAKVLGKIPTMSEFRKESKVSPATAAVRFKGWKGALSSAGFDPEKARFTYDDIELLEELRRVAGRLGRTPSAEEFNELSSMSCSTLIQRFGGSWEKACAAAKLRPFVQSQPTKVPAGWNRGYRKLKISEDDLRYLYEVEGLSASAIGRRLGVSRNSVRRVMEDYRIQVKRLHYSMPRETSIETMLYQELERRGVTYVRQSVIDGLWVVDALIPGARVCIECDGEYWHSQPEMMKRDEKKDRYLRSRGYKVVRFPEAAIHADVHACVQRIVDLLISRYKVD